MRVVLPAAREHTEMRILITNDDGVFAPGIAALARGLAESLGAGDDLLVVAPLTNQSGCGAAVGAVYDRESIAYESVEIPRLGRVPTFGIDGSPALAVILAAIGGFGAEPDLVVSGVNEGLNTGRSALHSGTVGAVLTAAQFGISGLAMSIAWASEPIPWETPVSVAKDLVPALARMAPATVLNVNVPAVPLEQFKGLRHGALGRMGLIRAVRLENTPEPVAGPPLDRTTGSITLTLRGGSGSDRVAERAELEPGSDAAIVADGWGSVTPLLGVHEDTSPAGEGALGSALDAYSAPRG
jgi:5'-nucleotidase